MKANNDNLTASEALFGFMGWLSSRDEQVVISATDDAAGLPDLVKEFMEANDLAEPRLRWHEQLVQPGATVSG